MRTRSILLIGLAGWIPGGARAQPSLQPLNPAPETEASLAQSACGSFGSMRACTGWSSVSGCPFITYWSPASGVVNVHEALDLGWCSWGQFISEDGSTVIIRQFSGLGPDRYLRWSVQRGRIPDPTLPAGWSLTAITGLTHDGEGFAANGYIAPGRRRAIRWLDGAALELGVLLPDDTASSAAAMTPDGRIIVGATDNSGARTRAFRWVEGAGMTDLGTLPGHTRAAALAVSRDGQVVAGTSGPSNAPHGFVWTAQNGMQPLDAGSGYHFFPLQVSDDGSLIIGLWRRNSGGNGAPYVWTLEGGVTPLVDYFSSAGLDASAWSFVTVGGMTSDASVIVGMGVIAGRQLGWVASGLPLRSRLQCKTDVDRNAFVDFFDYLEFVRLLESGAWDADFNNDGFVDFFDYADFVDAFESGC